jgi:hypothetical protein
MKEINAESYTKMAKKIRLRFGMTYYGASNHLQMAVNINEKAVRPDMMTDEQVVLLWNLVHEVENQLAFEQIKRDLLPDEIKHLYDNVPRQPVPLTMNDGEGN